MKYYLVWYGPTGRIAGFAAVAGDQVLWFPKQKDATKLTFSAANSLRRKLIPKKRLWVVEA